MYCFKCGVELADSEKKCPLCGTPVPTLDGERGEAGKEAAPPYPPYPGEVSEGIPRNGLLFVLSCLFFLPFCLCLLCDMKINGEVVWSGYASGALALLYVIAVLPCWFRRPNPVIFVPVDFAAAGLYLLYVNFATGGHWFLTLALPVLGGAALITTAVVALLRYTRGGELFILGGATLLVGGLSVLTEGMIRLTFGVRMFRWSVYPLTACTLLGLMLLVIGICRPFRESLKKRFFF